MAAIADAYVEIKPDTKGFGKALDSEVSRAADDAGTKAGGKFSQALGTAAKAGALAAGVAVGAFAANAVNQASNLGESVNAVNVTFGEAAAGVLKLGENAATSVGLSNSEFNGLAVQFSSFATTIAGKGGDVTGTLDGITTRAADFASVMNVEVADAAAIFQSGLAGETEPLKKYGIDLSAAAVETYALANGIGTAGEALTEQEKVQARYGALMEQTSKTQGDFANTSGSFANQQRILKAQFADMSAEVGAVLIPIMSKLFAVLLAALPTVKAAFLGLFDAVEKVIGFIGDNEALVIGVFTAFAVAVAAYLVPSFIAWATTAGAAAIATLAAAAPFIALGVALAAVAAGLVWAYQNVDFFRNAVQAVASFLTDTLWPAIQTAFMGALDVISTVMGVIVPIITTGFEIISTIVTTYIGIVVAIISTAWAIISTVVTTAMGVIQTIIEVAWAIISAYVTTYVNVVRTVIETVFGLLVGIVTGIWNGISSATQTAWNLIKTYVLGPIQSIRDTIGGVVSAIASTINGVWDGISSHASELWGKISGFVEGGINDIVGFVTGLPGRITSAVSGAFDGIGKAFRSAINVVIDAWNGLSLRFKGGPWDPLGTFGPTIPAVDFGIDTPNIPRLARGGITNGPMLAMLGDNRSGREAIVPLERAEEMGFGTRSGPVVAIENANFYDGTDADLVAQRTVAAMSAMQLAG